MPNILSSLLFLFVFIKAFDSFSQQEARFMITENNRIGYIDQTGKVIIQPVFINGGEFSDGLAAVRSNGKYGYIDIHGKFVIPEQYDFADAFHFGFACVYTNGNVKLIDKAGKEVVNNPNYRYIRLISPNKAIANIDKRLFQLIEINPHRKLSRYPLEEVSEFTDGTAIVSRLKKVKGGFDRETGLMDTNGRMLVDFGTYYQIKPFSNGFALVKSGYEKDDFEGFIDTKGKLVFKRKLEDQSYLYDDINSGITVIHFRNYWNSVEKKYSPAKKQYSGYINIKGEILLNDTLKWNLKDFSDGRTFIPENGKYGLYDTQLKRIGNESYNSVSEFYNGIAVVSKKGLYSIIDTNGNFLFEPKFDEITQVDHNTKRLIYESPDSEETTLYGIADFKGEPIGPAIIQRFDSKLFQNGLLRVIIDDKLCYINTEGVIVWKESPAISDELPALNSDYMLSGYFTALSEEDEEDLGGFGKSLNSAKQISGNFPFEANQLSVLVNGNQSDTSFAGYKGFRVYVANRTGETIRFGAQDSRLYMNVQAKDVNGEWKDIEHLPSSWCGNSYHTLKLMPNEYWPFVTPAYEGEYKTKLRIQLEYSVKGKKGTEELQTVYSNEYDGSVNPAQFWNNDHHIPTGIMDPYSY